VEEGKFLKRLKLADAARRVSIGEMVKVETGDFGDDEPCRNRLEYGFCSLVRSSPIEYYRTKVVDRAPFNATIRMMTSVSLLRTVHATMFPKLGQVIGL